jgi:hypothetical protein
LLGSTHAAVHAFYFYLLGSTHAAVHAFYFYLLGTTHAFVHAFYFYLPGTTHAFVNAFYFYLLGSTLVTEPSRAAIRAAGSGGLGRGLICIRAEPSNPGNDPGGPSRAAAAGARAEPIRPDFGRARSKKDRSNCQKQSNLIRNHPNGRLTDFESGFREKPHL